MHLDKKKLLQYYHVQLRPFLQVGRSSSSCGCLGLIEGTLQDGRRTMLGNAFLQDHKVPYMAAVGLAFRANLRGTINRLLGRGGAIKIWKCNTNPRTVFQSAQSK